MTDNDVIKALECCHNPKYSACKECPFHHTAKCTEVHIIARDLINRQKAEIERKTKHIAEIIDEYARFKEAAKRQEQARVRNIEQVADEEIKSLKAEIKNLNRAIKNFKATKERQRAEIERLQHILVSFMSEVENWDYKYNIDTSHIPQIAVLGTEKGNIIKQIKSEAYKEFAERLKKESYIPNLSLTGDRVISVDDIDNLLEKLQNGVKE